MKFSESIGDRHTSYFCRGTREEGQTVVVFNQADFVLCRQLVTKQSPESQATPVLATNHELLEREIRFILHLLLGFKLVISSCTFMLVANSIETVHCAWHSSQREKTPLYQHQFAQIFQKTSIDVKKIFTSKAIYRRHKLGLFTQHQWHLEYAVRRKQNHQSDAHYETKRNMYTRI